MYKFKSFEIEGVITHEKSRVDFTPGVHVIRGENASGKSSIFQALTKLVTNELPHTQKKSDREIKGTGRLIFERHGIPLDIKVDFGKAKYSIVRNNKLTEYRKATTSQIEVMNELPWSIEAWQNFVYVSSDTFPLLLKGKASQRRGVFEDLFNIDTSRQFKIVKGWISELDKFSLRVNALQEAFGGESIFKLRREQADYKRQIEGYEAEILDLEDELGKANPTDQKYWDELCEIFPMHDFSVEKLEALIEDMKYAQEDLDHHIHYRKILEAQGVKADLQHVLKSIDPDALLSDEDANRLTEIRLDKNKISAARKVKPVTKPDRETAENIEVALQALKSAKTTFKKCICPTCRQTVNDPKALISSYEDVLDKFEQQEKDYLEFKRLDDYRNYFETKYKLPLPTEKEIEAARLKLIAHGFAVKHAESIARLGRVTKYLDKMLADPLSKSKPQIKYERAKLLVELKEAAGPVILADRIKYLKSGAANSKARTVAEIQEDIAVVKSQINGIRQDLSAVEAKIYSWEAYYKVSTIRQIKELSRPALNLMHEVYGPRGIKLAATRHVVGEWLEEMNIAAERAYGPNYRFTAQMDSTGVHIDCVRTLNGRELISDVRRLSGAEAKLFPIASLIAMAEILPDELRTNILVLDELESNMTATTRKKFLDMLPVLQKVYESIWIVTPLPVKEFPIIREDLDVFEYRVELIDGISHLRPVRQQ